MKYEEMLGITFSKQSNEFVVHANQGYDFHFNDAYPKGIHKFEYYNLNTDAPFLRLFNCVGINSDLNSFIFIGFYYTNQNWISGDHYGAYDFLTWDLFFKEFFPEIAS